MTYSVRYREKGYTFEAKPNYWYPCFICGKTIHGPGGPGVLYRAGQEAINVLRNGKTWTVHAGCNKR